MVTNKSYHAINQIQQKQKSLCKPQTKTGNTSHKPKTENQLTIIGRYFLKIDYKKVLQSRINTGLAALLKNVNSDIRILSCFFSGKKYHN